MNLYEYLIGGKKTGKREFPAFEELKVGNEFYEYVRMYGQEYINILKIYKIKNLPGVGIQFEFAIEMRGEIPFDNKLNSFYIRTDSSNTKIYYATTMEELKEHIKKGEIKIRDCR